MRAVLCVILAIAACAEPARYTAVRTASGATRAVGLEGAIATARAQHYEVVEVDAAADSFVAIAPGTTTGGVRTAMIVRVSGGKITPRECNRGKTCLALGARVRVAVTPLAYREGKELGATELPDVARDRADELSWQILVASQH